MTAELIAICLIIPGTAFLLELVKTGKYARSCDLMMFRKEMHSLIKELRADIRDLYDKL